MQGQMRKPRLRMISGGRDGLPERRRTPRRPEPGRVRLVFTRPVRQDDAAAPPDAPPPVRVPASRGQAASAPTQPAPVARRREEPRPAPVKAHRPGIDGALPVSIWIFALVALGGALLTILEGMALLGPGLLALGVSGFMAPPRREVPAAQRRSAAILSVCGVVLVALGVVFEL